MKLSEDSNFSEKEEVLDKNNDNQRKKEITKRVVCVLMACGITFSGIHFLTSTNYEVEKSNPFDGNKANFSDPDVINKLNESVYFLKDESLQATKEFIKNSNMDEKKAYLLYYALISNDSLTEKEKKDLSPYIQYFIDNKDLNYEYVYDKLNSFCVKPNDPSLLEEGIAGFYTEDDNSFTFATNEERNYALSHESLHSEAMKGDSITYDEYAWFIEGLTCAINYEYFNEPVDGTDMKTVFIRTLCELIEPSILLKTRNTSDINILINALINKGLNEEEINELFTAFNDYNWADEEDPSEINPIKVRIISKLKDIYLKIYKDGDNVKPMFLQYLIYIADYGSSIIDKKYYFNTTKVGEIPTEKDSYEFYYAEDGTVYVSNDSSMLCEENEFIKEYYDDYIKVIERTNKQGEFFETTKKTFISKAMMEQTIDSLVERLEQDAMSL